MELVAPILNIVKFVGGPVVRYLEYQIKFNKYLTQFKVSKEDLSYRKHDIESRLDTELQSGNVAKEEVQRWLKDVEEFITGQDVEDEVNNWECLSCCCRVKILKERTQELKEIYDRGEKYTNECLVIEDHSRKLNAYMKNFIELKEKLQCKQRDVDSTLLAQLSYGKITKVEVKNWLQKVEEITGSAAKDIEDKINKGRDLSHASAPLKKLLEEKIQEMEKIYEEGDQLSESLVVDDPSSLAVELPTSRLQGSEDVKAEIFECLMGDEVTMLAVWGMGGVGKTTIMMHVNNELLKEGKFKKVIWVTVSQTFDIYKLQEQIACHLKEQLPQHQNSTVRAAVLSKMLERHMPYLLILDDVWRSFELKDVGIPKLHATDGCKLVLTTRSQEVARSMGCKRIKVKTLSQGEALKLFLDKVGDVVLSHKETSESTLMAIVDECGGLPLAIVTVAGSLKEISEPRLWNAALNQLRECKRNVAGTDDDDAFKILKFSYDRLKNPKIQYCFLCCALYPEDYDIPKETLVEYWIDEGFIDEMETRQAMEIESYDILRKFEENCLLEFIEGKYGGDDCVRMHDLIRDMAIHITSMSPRFLVKAGMALKELPEMGKWTEDLEKVSLMWNLIEEIPSIISSLNCTMLTTLLLSHNNLLTIPESVFEHMPELKILDLSFNYWLRSLPNSISKLVKLTTLLLLHLTSLIEVPTLSDLQALKKLDLCGTNIKEVPKGLEMLRNLKYLDLSTHRIDQIPDTILSNLFKLQLLLVDEARIALKGEVIGKLVKLEAFRGRFPTMQDLSIFLKCLPDQGHELNRYSVTVGRYRSSIISPYMIAASDKVQYKKRMGFTGIDIVGEKMLFSSVQVLSIEGCNNVRSLNDISAIKDAKDLRRCSILYCKGMECVLSSWINPLVQTLEYLDLYFLGNLHALFEAEAIVKLALSPGTFASLKTISIQECGKIKKLFPSRLLLGYLKNLEEIIVGYCRQMEEIIASDLEEEKESVIELILPNFRRLKLSRLPALKSICSKKAVLVCDSLEEIEILICKSLRRIPIYLSQLDHEQTFPPASLRKIQVYPEEWWESLEWVHPHAKDVLLPFCNFSL